jgi:hypothetical protein
MDRGYRVHTNIISDTFLNVNLQQDFDFLEVLSLKLRQKDTYRLHSSNYGVIVGRVLANDAFGIPNAKISLFIEKDGTDSREIENIYPYSDVTAKDKNARRYNILPDYSDDDCYRVVGTFPNKRLLLDDDIQMEIYDKYWKYTTVTNNAGDYMLFGVPTGSVTVHIDIDLSDIGILSQKPYDFLYKGHTLSEFDSTTQFKESTNLDYLSQIVTQNKSVFVYPFWGDADNGIACLTRADVQMQYKFETTCIFMGAIVSDNGEHSINNNCAVNKENGMNDQLVTSNGTIEMIRKTTDGLIEEYPIKSNYLIDNDGVWCYQIPMNLDYIGTDESGNIVPIDNPNKGIATRAQVRFRISKEETGDEGFSRHTAKYLVPMNPILNPEMETVNSLLSGPEVEKMYNFGSLTPNHCFRDLYWNNVYSVKNHIPKVQTARRPSSPKYSALKGANHAGDKNAIPFNKLRIDISFTYMVICLLFTIIIEIVCIINRDIIGLLCMILEVISKIIDVVSKIGTLGFYRVQLDLCPKCIKFALDDELSKAFAPCCCDNFLGLKGGPSPDCDDVTPDWPDGMSDGGDWIFDKEIGIDIMQRRLAEEFKIVKLDFYEDWLNGALYMPLWYWRKRRKRTFLFGLIRIKAKNDFCDCDNNKPYSRLKTYYSCNYRYYDNTLEILGDYPDWVGNLEYNNDYNENNIEAEKKWHKSLLRSKRYYYRHGIIKQIENMDGLRVYYYSVIQPTTANENPDFLVKESEENFYGAVLYATDIILLGNLNPDNLWGLPQFFTVLPQTTANVPPIGSIALDDTKESNVVSATTDDVTSNDEDGTILTTGMDWGVYGIHKRPSYKSGLFMDLACTYANTRLKACFNVERLSELGSNLDMAHRVTYSHRNDKNGYGEGYPNMHISNTLYGHNMDWIEADGFISKHELDDLYNRSTFATINHIGFMPQEAVNEINKHFEKDILADTQIEDERTGYLIPKYKDMFLVDFDGRLNASMSWYARDVTCPDGTYDALNGCKEYYDQATWDEKDDAYITYRLGAERSTKAEDNTEEKVRHFYYVPNTPPDPEEGYRMPYYNNSFYFYFGLTPGKTAIDKFNEGFYSTCSTKEVDTFTVVVNTQGVPYCPLSYNNHCERHAYIEVLTDSINKPYSFELYNTKNELILADEDVYKDSFAVGDGLYECPDFAAETDTFMPYSSYTMEFDSEKNEAIPAYILKMAEKAKTEYPERGGNPERVKITTSTTSTVSAVTIIDTIDNSDYTLKITDSNNNVIEQKIEVRMHKLGFIAYLENEQGDDDPEHKPENIVINEISVGGYDCTIVGVRDCGYNEITGTYDSWLILTNEKAQTIYVFAQLGCVTHRGNPIEIPTCFGGADPCHTIEMPCTIKWKPNRIGPIGCLRKWIGDQSTDLGDNDRDGHNDTYILTLTEACGAPSVDNLNHENSASEILTFDDTV